MEKVRQRHWRSEVWCVGLLVGAARVVVRRAKVVIVLNMVDESRLE